MLLEVEGDLSCYSDTLRATASGYRSELVVLSMFGPRNAVRSAWARLSKVSGRNKYHESITVGGRPVAKASNMHYTTQTAPLERGLLHCLMFHQQMGHNAPDLGFVYQTGPDAARRYFDRLARWCPVPMRSAWRAPLWDIGRAHGAVVEIPGHGLDVWQVSTKREVWEPIVQAAVLTGELT